MEAAQVIDAIKAAFPLGPLPEMSLHQGWLADQTMDREIPEEEWSAAGKADAGRNWMDFKDTELMARDEALAHLDEAAFVYYLPAFLLFAVRHCNSDFSDSAAPLVGTTVFSVTHFSPYSLGRYKRLDVAQREAVIAFLEFIATHANKYQQEQASKALAVYWKTDEASKPLIIIP